MTTTASPGEQTRSWVAATPRASVLRLGAGSSGSLPGPAALVPAEACGAALQSNPGPRPPIPQGPGLDLGAPCKGNALALTLLP
jgi:hypothetical protein